MNKSEVDPQSEYKILNPEYKYNILILYSEKIMFKILQLNYILINVFFSKNFVNIYNRLKLFKLEIK